MARFVDADRETAYLLPPSVGDWLAEDHLARFVVEIVDRLDLSGLVGQYAGRGSAAHHPSVLLALLIYGYATGTFSSRKIERATHDSVAFRFIAANTHPDHDTLASFRRRFLPQIEALFLQVLVAREMNVLKLGTIALDGTKIGANASRHAALSWKHALKIQAHLRQEVAALTARAEAADQTPVEEGLDIPAEIARREQRLLALEAAKAKIQARAQERFEAEQRAYEEIKARRQAKRDTGKNPSGQEPKPPQPGPKDSDQVNLTDEDSRIMPRAGGGFDQSYNAQAAVDAATMLVVATHLTQAPNDKRQVQPALEQLAALPKTLGEPTSLLADTGYFSAANVAACDAAAIAPMIAIGRQAHHMPVFERFAADTPPPDTDDPVLKMAHRLTTRGGRALYGLRKQTVEPVFGIIKQAMGWRRMSMRGLKAAQGEWALVTMAWNVKRLNALRLA
jgi:transposase